MGRPMTLVQTFVLRFWLEETDTTAQWRGVVIHVPTNEQTTVPSIEEAFALIQDYLSSENQSNKEEKSWYDSDTSFL